MPAKRSQPSGKPSVAVAVPCHNEAAAIAKVVADFRKALPRATVYVFDNASTDSSVALARKAGAQVHAVNALGKGNVLRAIFDELKEDVIILVDGDDTYPAEEAQALLAPILDGTADMVVGHRLEGASDANMKRLNQFGNRLIVAYINRLFGTQYADVLSGYRAFNRRFVESVPVLTSGFEVETEITLQALAEGLRVVEVPISYRSRPADSNSKLRPFADGYRIVLTAAILLRDHRPLRLFGGIAVFFWLLALAAGVLRLLSIFGQGSLPDSILGGVVLLGVPSGLIALGIGLSLNAINTRFQEIKTFLRRSQ
ncbi:MAG: glycosyltransferase [Anaerolineales bacterium]|nr:glycosyltransferase [Anaerolineales bacterium]